MVSSLTKKFMEGTFRMIGPMAIKELPRVATRLVKEWNGMVLRGEMDRARAAIHAEFVKNRQLASMLYEKYQNDMSPAVAAIYREAMEKR